MADPEGTAYLAIRECPLHHCKSICIEGVRTGAIRLTPTKCCGRWDLVRRWKVDPIQIVADIEDVTGLEVDRG